VNAGYNQGQSHGQMMTQHVHHHNVQAIDRAGVERVLGHNKRAVFDAVARAIRSGRHLK
jgi:hypothetical protein